jgi:hypothetical protein
MMFTDAQFMTAHQKDVVLKDWERFLRHRLKKPHFTGSLYEHLHLHCGFIAHYNIQGFYSTYFEAGHDIERFFEHFCSYTAQSVGAYAEYHDLHTAMREAFEAQRPIIMRQADEDVGRKIALLSAAIRKARKNRDFARQLLGKIRL